MGQEASAESRQVSTEELSHELALRFAEKCYTQLELYCFKHVFRNLADEQSDIKYWTEASLCRFLELPDKLEAGPIVYQMTTFLGAFPFPSQAPCIVTKEALLKVVTIMTQRYTRVLKRGDRDRLRLFYGSLAVFDRRASETMSTRPRPEHLQEDLHKADFEKTLKGVSGFAIDESANDAIDDGDDEDDDNLALAALDSLDAIEAISLGDRPNIQHSIIPTDNFLKLVELLLLIAPLQSQESLSKYAAALTDQGVQDFRSTAQHIVSAFNIDEEPGILYKHFKIIVPATLPHAFDGFNALFEHFLFQKDFDLSRRKRSSTTSAIPMSPTSPTPTSPTVRSPVSPKQDPIAVAAEHTLASLVPDSSDNPILTVAALSQLAFFLSPATLFGRLHFLYSGATHGFSLGSFEKTVFTWKGPSILLVTGSVLPDAPPRDSRERTFASILPPRRFPPGHSTSESASGPARVTYGAYIPPSWKHTHKEPLHDAGIVLFQLSPTHDTFSASTISTAHLTFAAPPHSPVPGIALGCPLPAHSSTGHRPVAALGAISLFLNDALEFGVFTHASEGGGSFRSSVAPMRRRRGRGDWEDRFEVDAVEVWGLGGEGEVRGQQRALEFEEREARMRREGRGSVSGIEADRELLKMAGLIGRGETGGSMG